MHNVRRFLATLLVLVSLTAYGAEMNNLGDYQWKNRLILVQAASETEGAAEILRDARAELDDRDVIWFVNTGEGLVSNQATVSGGVEHDINELLAKGHSEDRVLLIGKDGGIKSRESSLDLDAIFRRIDAMPMRIREMRTGD
ncbi:DUF4174 domain-containing protein [Marinobacter sp. F4206]|uniref:DUF4174 domain-containing protein n=1 Tax=Marinobacter sp. F4206 TaxID=2861777 RepID=UPI002150BEF0|nr:DUF4174 domain-containing protein [Marinobacter sp. F4206]